MSRSPGVVIVIAKSPTFWRRLKQSPDASNGAHAKPSLRMSRSSGLVIVIANEPKSRERMKQSLRASRHRAREGPDRGSPPRGARSLALGHGSLVALNVARFAGRRRARGIVCSSLASAGVNGRRDFGATHARGPASGDLGSGPARRARRDPKSRGGPKQSLRDERLLRPEPSVAGLLRKPRENAPFRAVSVRPGKECNGAGGGACGVACCGA